MTITYIYIYGEIYNNKTTTTQQEEEQYMIYDKKKVISYVPAQMASLFVTFGTLGALHYEAFVAFGQIRE